MGKAYLLALCGAGDRPIEALGGRTPLEVAVTPTLDRMAASGRQASVEVIGESIAPESDSGAMALLGYDPLLHYTGRGALEGLGMGFLDPAGEAGCACFRLNFASYDEARGRIDRRTARDLSLEEQAELVAELRAGVRLADHPDVTFELVGFGRHRGIVCFHSPGREMSGNVTNTDPGFRRVAAFGIYNERFPPQPQPCQPLDDSPGAAFVAELVERFSAEARRVLAASPVNARRAAGGRLPANVLLLRDGGHAPPELVTFRRRFGADLSMYGQIPSEHGLCRLLGGRWHDSQPPEEGLADHYRSLARQLLDDPADVVFVHVKGPDEPAHDGSVRAKIDALELIDRELLAPLAAGLGPDDLLVATCDHRTPCEIRVHSDDPVPLLLSGRGVAADATRAFSESEAEDGELGIARACELMDVVAPLLRKNGGRPRSGALLRSLINDLKRNDEVAAAELGVDLGDFRAMLAGERPVPAPVVQRAVEIWPLNERDFHTVRDDCPDGVRLFRRSESEASARILERGGRGYYEYRDTAMSRIAMYRPEWIRMLQVVDGEDPDDPRVEWNDGHLLHQFTYFVGEINYYYAWSGRRRCAAMRTGDSVWGLPFAAHSFAARRAGEPAHILALTYGAGLVGDAQHELSALGVETARRLAMPVTDDVAAGAALLRLHVAGAGLTPGALGRASGLGTDRVEALLGGTARAEPAELERLAASLEVHVRDLLPVTGDTEDGVRIRRAGQVPRWGVPDDEAPDYRLGRLAGSRLHPFTRGLEVDVLAGPGRPAPAALETACHQYVYSLGPDPARLSWTWDDRRFDEVLEAGDSLYVRPFVPLRLRLAGEGARSRLLALRIAGKTRLEAMTELGAMAPEGVARVVAEDRQWYRAAGSARPV